MFMDRSHEVSNRNRERGRGTWPLKGPHLHKRRDGWIKEAQVYKAYTFTLKLKQVCPSETSMTIYGTTRHYIPEQGTLLNERLITKALSVSHPFKHSLVSLYKKSTI
jgi:hypothetical protein